jgi:hypothetical protein
MRDSFSLSEHRNPLSRYLIAQIERRDFDFGSLTQQCLRHPIEERTPV